MFRMSFGILFDSDSKTFFYKFGLFKTSSPEALANNEKFMENLDAIANYKPYWGSVKENKRRQKRRIERLAGKGVAFLEPVKDWELIEEELRNWNAYSSPRRIEKLLYSRCLVLFSLL